MPDLIHAMQRVVEMVYPELVQFRQELWAQHGIEFDKHRARQARLGAMTSHRLFSRKYAGVPGRVHLHDNMLMNDGPEELAHYVKVGESAIENIEAALAAAGKSWSGIGAALDFPSGYGRVLRHLVKKVEPAQITACELEPEGLMFCAQEFGVRPVQSSKQIGEIVFPEKYDLIWVGSLFTHLPPDAGKKLLAKLAAQLAAGGILLFSTQGPSCLVHAENYGFMFAGRKADFEKQYAAAGCAYLDYYAHDPGYGITFYSPEVVRGIIAHDLNGCREVLYRERGLDAHQDVWGVEAKDER